MFPLKVQRALHTSFLRLIPRAPRSANPGIAYQREAYDDPKDDAVSEISADPEGFGNMESDFMQVHRTHRQHEADLERQRERIRQLMVKQKYFHEEQLPNLLTYAEKEQIRLLHIRDPEEWTVERLAESFPATKDIISKILRAKWRPRTTQRIRTHDEAVIRNWELLRTGKLEKPIRPELLLHLQKFAARKTLDLQQTLKEQWPTRTQLPKPSGTEFLSLITSCSKYAEDNQPKQQQLIGVKQEDIPIASKEEETYLLSKVIDKRKMRLHELKQKKLNVEDSKTLEQHAVETLKNPSGTGIIATNKNTTQLPSFTQKFESSEIVISTADQRRYEMNKLKERVHIPRRLYKKGATYRVEDAYYDDDGEFLYRVPGMTGKI